MRSLAIRVTLDTIRAPARNVSVFSEKGALQFLREAVSVRSSDRPLTVCDRGTQLGRQDDGRAEQGGHDLPSVCRDLRILY